MYHQITFLYIRVRYTQSFLAQLTRQALVQYTTQLDRIVLAHLAAGDLLTNHLKFILVSIYIMIRSCEINIFQDYNSLNPFWMREFNVEEMPGIETEISTFFTKVILH